MSVLCSICEKCGGVLKSGSSKMKGGVNACHARKPSENHNFSILVKKPLETENQYYNRIYKKYYNDGKGHYIVFCNACNAVVQGNKHYDFGCWFKNHLRQNHPYPY